MKEVYIQNKIGNVKKIREEQIEEYKSGNKKVLYYKKLDGKYSYYQIDANEPSSKDYYAYKLFLDYYGLDKDVKIVFVKQVVL